MSGDFPANRVPGRKARPSAQHTQNTFRHLNGGQPFGKERGPRNVQNHYARRASYPSNRYPSAQNISNVRQESAVPIKKTFPPISSKHRNFHNVPDNKIYRRNERGIRESCSNFSDRVAGPPNQPPMMQPILDIPHPARTQRRFENVGLGGGGLDGTFDVPNNPWRASALHPGTAYVQRQDQEPLIPERHAHTSCYDAPRRYDSYVSPSLPWRAPNNESYTRTKGNGDRMEVHGSWAYHDKSPYVPMRRTLSNKERTHPHELRSCLSGHHRLRSSYSEQPVRYSYPMSPRRTAAMGDNRIFKRSKIQENKKVRFQGTAEFISTDGRVEKRYLFSKNPEDPRAILRKRGGRGYDKKRHHGDYYSPPRDDWDERCCRCNYHYDEERDRTRQMR